MTVVTGVSGPANPRWSTTSSIARSPSNSIGSREEPGAHKSISGHRELDKVIRIDQSPIGRTPRSNPATYTGMFTPDPRPYAMLPESRERGYKPGRFYFNVPGGRCEACQGEGQRRIEMNFLPDVYVQCEVCGGTPLQSRDTGGEIQGLLDRGRAGVAGGGRAARSGKHPAGQAETANPGGRRPGIHSSRPVGGDALRRRSAAHQARARTEQAPDRQDLYLLDEPTTGLHFDDVRKLLDVLHRLTDLGNTVIIIEHNLDVIRNADWVIDLGPEGGEEGGRIVAQGTPEQVARVKSLTLDRHWPHISTARSQV